MSYTSEKTVTFVLVALLLTACTSNEAQNGGASSASSARLMTEQTQQPIEVLREYHKALISGDSIKAVSLTTGTARAILEYRFYRSQSDDELQFTYGRQNILRDTCYIPLDVRSRTTQARPTEGKAILVKVGGEWKVERIAMQ
jgi:hypothetical protein